MQSKVTRRGFLGLVGMSVTGAMLAACAPKSAPQGGESSGGSSPSNTVVPAAKEKQIVTFSMFGHPGLIEQMVPIFNETHEGIEVQFERSEGQGYAEKVAAAVAGGSAWDCFRVAPADALRYGSKGAAIDLKPLEEADTTYPESLYLPGLLDAYNYQGKRCAIAVYVSTMWLYYNKKLFDEAGIDYPNENTTWEEYVEMCRALTKTDSNGMITQYGANGWGGWTIPVAQDVWTGGGCFYYNKDLSAICMDDPATIKVLQDESDLMNVDKVEPSPLNPPSTPATLLSDKVATQIDGDWLPQDNIDAWKDDYDATLCPLRDGKRLNCYFADPMVISNQSKVPEAAYQWLSWFSADPESWKIQGVIVFPTTERMYKEEEYRKLWLKTPHPPHMIELADQSAGNMQIWRVEAHSAEFENTVYTPEMDNLWRNKATAEEVCKTITEKGNELLAKPIA